MIFKKKSPFLTPEEGAGKLSRGQIIVIIAIMVIISLSIVTAGFFLFRDDSSQGVNIVEDRISFKIVVDNENRIEFEAVGAYEWQLVGPLDTAKGDYKCNSELFDLFKDKIRYDRSFVDLSYEHVVAEFEGDSFYCFRAKNNADAQEYCDLCYKPYVNFKESNQ